MFWVNSEVIRLENTVFHLLLFIWLCRHTIYGRIRLNIFLSSEPATRSARCPKLCQSLTLVCKHQLITILVKRESGQGGKK